MRLTGKRADGVNGQTNREVNTMKIFMTGGTGFVGTTLTEKLTQEKHQD
jgi:hypothetical protein